MDTNAKSLSETGRYLLLLDILGFQKLLATKGSEDVYRTIDAALQPCYKWERWNGNFKTIYYADTLLFYQYLPHIHSGFLDVYAIGRMIFSALLAQGIPTRGAIAYGDFLVKGDTENRHNIFVGKAHLEAYQAEQLENWIGISVCPSAWKAFEEEGEKGAIERLAQEGCWRIRQSDEVLLLNPFGKLRHAFQDDLLGQISLPYHEWDVPEFPNDLKGFRFLIDQSSQFKRNGDFTGKVAVKYHNTVVFLQDVLGKDCFAWADKISGSFSK